MKIPNLIQMKHKKVYLIILLLLTIFIGVKMMILKVDDNNLSYVVKRGAFIESVEASGAYNRTYSDLERAKSNAAYQLSISFLATANQNKESADTAMWLKRQAVLDSQNSENYKNDNTTNPSTKKDYTDLEKKMIDSNLILAQKDYNAAEKKYKESGVAIAAAQAQVASAKVDYEETLINEPLLSVDVNEVYVPNLYVGQKVKVIFDALKDTEFTGMIRSIDSAGSVNSGVVTFEVKIAVDNLPEAIKPNMTATVRIDLINKTNVMAVPKSAIISKDNKSYVQKIGDRRDNLTEVQLGEKGFAKVEVVSGLQDGSVIFANLNTALKND